MGRSIAEVKFTVRNNLQLCSKRMSCQMRPDPISDCRQLEQALMRTRLTMRWRSGVQLCGESVRRTSPSSIHGSVQTTAKSEPVKRIIKILQSVKTIERDRRRGRQQTHAAPNTTALDISQAELVALLTPADSKPSLALSPSLPGRDN